MTNWSLDDIPWHQFERAQATPELVALAKAASMVEYNGHDYARYLCEVFPDDAEFQQAARDWAEEEIQHGRALRTWAELADPSFDFDKSFEAFTTGYKLPQNVTTSVRGSRCGELIARCVVEIGTSSYYTAIKDATKEPVLREIAGRIAADEFRHYKLFYTHLKRYLEKDKVGALSRLRIALSRIAESEDDELAYAFFTAQNNDGNAAYDRKTYSGRYLGCAAALYRKPHIDKMTAMVLKAAGIKPPQWLQRLFSRAAWSVMQFKRVTLGSYRQQVLLSA